jgi:alpha-ribazole phosphatase
MKLTLIRHTSLQVPVGVCYGQSDIDVAASFANELELTKAKIAGMMFDAVYTSPLQRCDKLAVALNIGEVVHDARLKELHFGDWEMQAWDDIPRNIFDDWAHNYANKAPPNGETFSQLQQRALSFLAEMLVKHADEHIVVISHGGVIRALLAHALNMELKGLFRFGIDYGGVTQMEFGELESGKVPKINYVNL